MTVRVQCRSADFDWRDSGLDDHLQVAIAALIEAGISQFDGHAYRIAPQVTYTVTFTEDERAALISVYYGNEASKDTRAAVKKVRNAKADQ